MNSELIENLRKNARMNCGLQIDSPLSDAGLEKVKVNREWLAADALEKAALDLIAAEKALTDSEARNHFLETEITYCAERLAKLAEKKVR